MKLAVVQDLKELKFMQNKLTNIKVFWLPLDLDAFLHCYKFKLDFIDPINFIDNQVHKDAILSLEQLKKQINELKFDYKIINKELYLLIRHYLSSIIFFYELINKIKKIEKIYVSGWDVYEGPNVDKFKKKNYFISQLISNIFLNKKVILLSKPVKQERKNNLINYIYTFSKFNLSNKKNVLITNRFYNFKRLIIYFFRSRKIKTFIPYFPEDKSNYKEFFLNLLGIKKIRFKKEIYNKQIKIINYNKKKIYFKYKSKNFSNLIKKRLNQLTSFIYDLKVKSDAIFKLLKNYNFDLIVSNGARKTAGIFLENSIILNQNSFCISHGTISEPYNKYDKIYKKLILDSVIDTNSKYIAAQSKIAENALKKFKINKKKILASGNLVFSQNKINFLTKKNKILYAVTNKNFYNFHFFGVEQYYEFFSNLIYLDKIAKNNSFDILVQIHPTAHYLKKSLEEIFNNLSFSIKSIDANLKKSFVLVSFSSSTIEDSLFNKVPVILFDRWKRYLHFKPKKSYKNNALYYVNNGNEFIQIVNKIKNIKKFNYNDYVSLNGYNENIKNIFKKILKF